MLKYSSLILLVAVAVFWSHDVDAKPHIPYKRSPLSRASYKREIEDSDEISSETGEALVKELLVGLLLVTADTSTEERILSEKFKEALDRKWDSLDDFGKHIAQVYEEVTGDKDSDESEDSDESDESEGSHETPANK